MEAARGPEYPEGTVKQRLILTTALSLLFAVTPGAQVNAQAPLAAPADVATITGIVRAREDYRRKNFPTFERDGLYETEIGRHVERFGNVAQVRSVAVARRSPDGPPLGRYVNYFQLYWDGARWWIAGMVWDEETPSRPIPAAWVGRFDGPVR
jgi:hypothetical protein